jgi:hypothetical protein
MDESNTDSTERKPRLQSALSYILLVLAFGVIVPRLKGLEFFDPVIMAAYACMGMVFSGPAAAQAFSTRPRTWAEALRWILQAVLFGELIAAAMLFSGILTVYITHLRTVFFLPDTNHLAIFGVLGLAGSLALASLAAWVALQFSAGVARGTLRVVFLALLAVFFLRSQWLPTVAGQLIPVGIIAAAVFLELLRRELKGHATRTAS